MVGVLLFSEKKGLSKMVLGFYLFSDFFFPPAYSNQSGPGSSKDG